MEKFIEAFKVFVDNPEDFENNHLLFEMIEEAEGEEKETMLYAFNRVIEVHEKMIKDTEKMIIKTKEADEDNLWDLKHSAYLIAIAKCILNLA